MQQAPHSTRSQETGLQSTGLTNLSLQGNGRGKIGSSALVETFTTCPTMQPFRMYLLALGEVFTHLMDAKVGIGVKVVVFGCHVLSIGLLTAFCLATGHLRERSSKGVTVGSPEPPQPGEGLTTPAQPSSSFLPSFPREGSHFQHPPRAPSREQPPRLPSLQALCPVSSSAHSWGGRKGRAEPGQTQGKPGRGLEMELRKQPWFWGASWGREGVCPMCFGGTAGEIGLKQEDG